MKTTIDIADSLLNQAKMVARQNKITLRDLTQEGLELAMERRTKMNQSQLELVTFGNPRETVGTNLDWETIRPLVYGP